MGQLARRAARADRGSAAARPRSAAAAGGGPARARPRRRGRRCTGARGARRPRGRRAGARGGGVGGAAPGGAAARWPPRCGSSGSSTMRPAGPARRGPAQAAAGARRGAGARVLARWPIALERALELERACARARPASCATLLVHRRLAYRPAAAARCRGSGRRLSGGAAEHLDGDLGDLGRGAPDAHALRFERLRLGGGGAGASRRRSRRRGPSACRPGAVKPAM